MYRMKKEVYEKILETIGIAQIESGGIIGKKNGVICKFYFDDSETRYTDKYVPDFIKLNKIIEKWYDDEIFFAGIVHSHPNSCAVPSKEDEVYVSKLMENNSDLNSILFPIVTKYKGVATITFFEFTGEFKEIDVTVY